MCAVGELQGSSSKPFTPPRHAAVPCLQQSVLVPAIHASMVHSSFCRVYIHTSGRAATVCHQCIPQSVDTARSARLAKTALECSAQYSSRHPARARTWDHSSASPRPRSRPHLCPHCHPSSSPSTLHPPHLSPPLLLPACQNPSPPTLLPLLSLLLRATCRSAPATAPPSPPPPLPQPHVSSSSNSARPPTHPNTTSTTY